jgi:hypothetical protein
MNIQAINIELSRIGYRAVKLPKARKAKGPVGPVAWRPQTAGGRACKAAMLRWSKWPAPRVSVLPHLLAMFGFKLQDVNPWPQCGPGNYGPALTNAMRKPKRLALPDYGRMADGSPVNVVLGRAAGPVTRIFCS